MISKRILVVTPRFPFDLWGACEQDRAHGIRILKELGYDVRVVTMCYQSHLTMVSEAEHRWGVSIFPVLYASIKPTPRSTKISRIVKRLFVPLYWDGAAHEYRDKEIQEAVRYHVEDFSPHLVWFDSTYLWPLHHTPVSKGIPIIVRSLNYEPSHFLGKTKKNPIDLLKYAVKVYGERQNLLHCKTLFSITPKEQLLYERISPKSRIVCLPLRALGTFIGKNSRIYHRERLNVCFMGSNYSVHHMLQGLLFILNKVNPLLQKTYPGSFTIHILGGKIPESVKRFSYPGVILHGYVDDLEGFLNNIDIALSPSLSGEGMQQKIFEPIVRGIPTITSARALVGYPFRDGVHVVTTDNSPESFVEAFGFLKQESERERISKNAIDMARSEFSDELMKAVMFTSIEKALKDS